MYILLFMLLGVLQAEKIGPPMERAEDPESLPMPEECTPFCPTTKIFKLLLAQVVICQPPMKDSDSVDYPEFSEDLFIYLKDELQETAIELEIVDAREIRYVLSRIDDRNTDLQIVRRRYAELKDAPLLGDADRLPARIYGQECMKFNRAYKEQLMYRRANLCGQVELISEVMRSCDRLYEVWDSITDAQCPYYYISVRRAALKRIKERLGSKAYYSGKWPPSVPIEWFQEN